MKNESCENLLAWIWILSVILRKDEKEEIKKEEYPVAELEGNPFDYS